MSLEQATTVPAPDHPVQVIFMYHEQANKWEALIKGCISEQEARQAFAAVIVTIKGQMYDLTRTVIKPTLVPNHYTAEPVVIIESQPRRDDDPITVAIAAKAAMEQGVSLQFIAKAVGRSEANLSMCLKFLDFPLEIRDMIRKGYVSAYNARELHTYCPSDQWHKYAVFAGSLDHLAFRLKLIDDFPYYKKPTPPIT